MVPIKSIVEIKFLEPAKQFDFLSPILQSLNGDTMPAEKIEGGARIKLKDAKTFILIEPRRLALNTEAGLTVEKLKNLVDDVFFTKILKYLEYGETTRIGVRTFWAKEASDFDSLFKKSKETFFNNSNSLLADATDLGLPLTFKNRNSTINYNFGPMTKEQFNSQYSLFPENSNICDFFSFIDVDYHQNVNRNMPIKRDLLEYIEEAYRYSKDKVTKTFESLEK